MRRYGSTAPRVTVPGRDGGLNFQLRPLEPCAEADPCVPEITGLFWWSDATGAYDQAAEAAYLLPEGEGPAGPVLAVAGLRGETCGAPVTWSTDWTPTAEGGVAPGFYEDGARLIVYPQADTAPGDLAVTATYGGSTYGPIVLGVVRYV